MRAKNIKGSVILLLAAFIWGTAFVAQTSGAELVGTFTFNSSRSFVGATFLCIVIAVMNLINRKKNDKIKNKIKNNNELNCTGIKSTGIDSRRTKWPVKGGIVCGIVLCMAMALQQYGISIYPEGVAASGRAGFLTATYVVMVAVFSVFLGKKLHVSIIISTIVCVIGMYLLCLSGGMSGIYMGDVCELLCAVCFTGHILVIEHFSSEDSIKLSCIQFLVCGIISAIIMVMFENVDIHNLIGAALPILYAGVMSSGVAYTLQMAGQKYVTASVASIVMSLESVFAALAGWILLNEVLSIREIAGCVLVFAAVLLAQMQGSEGEAGC